MEAWDKDIRELKGVGEKRAALYRRLGIQTLGDLLYHFPRSYEDRSVVKPILAVADGEVCCVRAVAVSDATARRIRNKLTLYTLRAEDETGSMEVVWFNMAYVKDAFHRGDRYYFYGKIETFGRRRRMTSPIFEREDKRWQTGRIMPLYPLTSGLTQTMVQSAVRQAADAVCDAIGETLPAALRRRYRLAELRYALRQIHFPDSMEAMRTARRRFVFEELLTLETGVLRLRRTRTSLPGIPMAETEPFRFPFSPTGAQLRATEEIRRDMARPHPMNRLLQGDVGSGKTAVAAAAIYHAVQNGYQAALMAPTEILATQHVESLSRALSYAGIEPSLLIGAMTEKQKRELLERVASGAARVVVGTHALLSERVRFARLGLVVTDEQHRFGVEQRRALTEKGENPHVLVMTATPIPRTLSLAIYGDLDVSVLDELPPGRQPVRTFAVDESMRPRIWRFIEKQVEAGRQAYIVCPLVEESETSSLEAVTTYVRRLQKDVFPQYRIALLHGKMKGREKDATMRRFLANEVQILVATSVIEVGVDAPNASLMVIENAERFGLSQLHQLRGRVGRGGGEAFCVLFNQGTLDYAKERMEIMCRTGDGFEIAERDLELRGPGDYFGTRQHGLPPLKIANIMTDVREIGEARRCAAETLDEDPTLTLPKNRALRKQVLGLFDSNVTFH